MLAIFAIVSRISVPISTVLLGMFKLSFLCGENKSFASFPSW